MPTWSCETTKVITDHDATISTPAWFAKNGKGYVIESQAGKLTMIIKCIRDGKLSITLRGRDVRDQAGEKIPFWIDFHSMTYNSEKIFDTTKPVWHNAPFSFSRTVEDGEIIMLRWEWGLHKPCERKGVTASGGHKDRLFSRIFGSHTKRE